MDQLMTDIIDSANDFVENYHERGIFDYSFKSLHPVDEILDEMSDFIFDDENLVRNASVMVGSYVFETVRKNYGGEYFWIREENQPVLVIGLPDFSVTVRAWEKVKGRIVNGSEDNIPFYIDGVKRAVAQGKEQQGYAAAII